MTAIKKSSRPIISKGDQVYNKYVPFLCDNKCFLTTEKLSPTLHMFLFETTSILLFMNIMLFIWYLITIIRLFEDAPFLGLIFETSTEI